jgi:hypothetical protein
MYKAFPYSDYYGLIWLPKRHRWLYFWLSFSTTVLVEHLWISQVLNTSLHRCHDLITPLTRHNLTFRLLWITAALHRLQWRYKPLQPDLKFIGAIQALQDHDNPYGLYNSLCTLHQYCSRDAVFTAEKHSLISHSAKGATLDTGGWLNFTWQGLTPCKTQEQKPTVICPDWSAYIFWLPMLTDKILINIKLAELSDYKSHSYSCLNQIKEYQI